MLSKVRDTKASVRNFQFVLTLVTLVVKALHFAGVFFKRTNNNFTWHKLCEIVSDIDNICADGH